MRGQLERQRKPPEHSSKPLPDTQEIIPFPNREVVFVKKDLKQKFVGNFVNIYMLSPRKGKL